MCCKEDFVRGVTQTMNWYYISRKTYMEDISDSRLLFRNLYSSAVSEVGVYLISLGMTGKYLRKWLIINVVGLWLMCRQFLKSIAGATISSTVMWSIGNSFGYIGKGKMMWCAYIRNFLNIDCESCLRNPIPGIGQSSRAIWTSICVELTLFRNKRLLRWRFLSKDTMECWKANVKHCIMWFVHQDMIASFG